MVQEHGVAHGEDSAAAREQGGMQKLEAMLVARLKALESELAESRAVIEGLKSSEVPLPFSFSSSALEGHGHSGACYTCSAQF
jgi:hypothetical protein